LTEDRCPVCQARFRGARTCSRCGADLTRPMLLAAEAWRLRERARAAVASGEFERGYELAAQAQDVRQTRAGESLRTVCEWLGGPAGWSR
jgi:predicted amidophosphoribosyltransferase